MGLTRRHQRTKMVQPTCRVKMCEHSARIMEVAFIRTRSIVPHTFTVEKTPTLWPQFIIAGTVLSITIQSKAAISHNIELLVKTHFVGLIEIDVYQDKLYYKNLNKRMIIKQ